MTEQEKAGYWKIADRISDAIVDILRKETETMMASGQGDPFQLLVGQLFALKATERTFPEGASLPLPLKVLYTNVDLVLEEIMRFRKTFPAGVRHD